ncbi:MAG: hypothetical protein KBE54_05790, partial [Bilophila sp.]|nr:hypothetical protein [Bilophila sp.]
QNPREMNVCASHRSSILFERSLLIFKFIVKYKTHFLRNRYRIQPCGLMRHAHPNYHARVVHLVHLPTGFGI